MAASPASCLWAALLFLGFIWLNNSLYCNASQIELGSRLVASNAQTWDSDNGTFAFGFTPPDTDGRFLLGIWFAQLPGDKAVVWSANRNSPVGKDAVLELDNTGNLILVDGTTTVWTSNTSHSAVEFAVMSESGNFMLLSATNQFIWQSFSHPSDTLLPNQPLNAAMELTSFKSLSHGGYYALKMLQQPTSLSLGLTYNLPQVTDASSEAYNNYSYWSGPDISNVTGEVVAVLDETGSFGIVYGECLYRWDNDVNGSRQWVPEWAAVSNPCDIAGICGNGVCNLDRSKTNASCTCLPRTSKSGGDSSCSMNSSAIGNIASKNWVFSSVSAAFNLTLTSRLP